MAFISARSLPKLRTSAIQDSDTRNPVEVVGDSVVFTPNEMKINEFYPVELNGARYLYKRISSGEVEVYGLAD